MSSKPAKSCQTTKSTNVSEDMQNPPPNQQEQTSDVPEDPARFRERPSINVGTPGSPFDSTPQNENGQAANANDEVEATNVRIAVSNSGNDAASSSTSIRPPHPIFVPREIIFSRTLEQNKGIYGDWIDTAGAEQDSSDDEKN